MALPYLNGLANYGKPRSPSPVRAQMGVYGNDFFPGASRPPVQQPAPAPPQQPQLNPYQREFGELFGKPGMLHSAPPPRQPNMGAGIQPPFQWRGGGLPKHMFQQGWTVGSDGMWYPPGSQPPDAQLRRTGPSSPYQGLY